MKILLVCKSLPETFKGGIQTHVWALSGEFIKLGLEVSILTGGSMLKGRRIYQKEGRQIIELPYLRGKLFPFLSVSLEEFSFNVATAVWLKRFHKKYDVLHLQGRSGYLFSYLKLQRPVVQTVHRLLKIESKWSTDVYTNRLDRWLHEQVTYFLEKKGVLTADQVIAVSQSTINEIANSYPLITKSIQLIYNGAHLEEGFKAANYQELRLLFVGRLTKIKGVFPLLEAMKFLPKTIRLVMVGDGPARASIENMIREYSLQDRVELLGSKEKKEVRQLMKDSFALILPSYHESQGIVLMEANAVGRPVLAANSAGIREVVKHKKNGLLFPSGAPLEIVKAVNYLLANPQRSESMGAWGYKWIQDQFSWEHIAKQTLKIYQGL